MFLIFPIMALGVAEDENIYIEMTCQTNLHIFEYTSLIISILFQIVKLYKF